jgi:hypothetical protein
MTTLSKVENKKSHGKHNRITLPFPAFGQDVGN